MKIHPNKFTGIKFRLYYDSDSNLYPHTWKIGKLQSNGSYSLLFSITPNDDNSFKPNQEFWSKDYILNKFNTGEWIRI